jgi:hypothetical protein
MNDAYAYRLMGNGEGEWEVSVLGAVRRGQHVRSLEPVCRHHRVPSVSSGRHQA